MAITDLLKAVNSIQDSINENVPLTTDNINQLDKDGFIVQPTYPSDGNGLPFSHVTNNRDANFKRNIITWFVPQFGIVRMYVNPSSIVYNERKIISKDRTKGGYTLQYWGEELPSLNINGTTGSSGIEGINVLEQIYRAEQYAFDNYALLLAANNSNNSISTIFSGIGENLGGNIGGAIGQVIGGVLDSGMTAYTNVSSMEIPSLAQLAFTVEMYYNGCVYRGFFENMTVTESSSNFLFEYQITFTVTQKRGYRLNYFPWSRSPANGPSEYNTPHSYSGKIRSGP